MKSAQKPPSTIKLFFLIVGLPALLLLVGLWQMSRAPGANPLQIVAISEITFCALAIVINGWGLLSIKVMGRKSMRSRDDLLRIFVSGQKNLPWLLAGTSIFLLCAVVCGLIFEIMYFVAAGVKNTGNIKLFFAEIIFLLFMLWAILQLMRNIYKASRRMFESWPVTLLGRCATEEEAPALWSFVRMVANKAKATLPTNIIIGLDQCFFVTESPVTLNSGTPAPLGRTLYLPLPYLAFMGRDEAAAVIGHELAHFQGADTEYSLKFSPIYATAVRNLHAIHDVDISGEGYLRWLMKPAIMLGEFFLRAFDGAVQHWSRQRELAADAVGAAVSDKRSIALSLLRISVLSPRIESALVECWNKAGKVQGGILGKIIRDVKSQGVGDPRAHLEDEQPHPTDSHPTTSQRLAALGVEVDAALLAAAGDLTGSALLQELDLYETTDPGSSQDTTAATKEARSALGLEAEFILAADESMVKEIAALRRPAGEGLETLFLYEGSPLFVVAAFVIGIIASLSAVGLAGIDGAG